MRLILVPFIALALAACEKKSADPVDHSTHVAPSATGKQVAVAVGEDGFAPSEVKLPKGEVATLVFTRTTDKTCAKEVEFPDLKVKKELPLNQPVAVLVPTGEARTLSFQCGMGMFKSKVVVQ